MKRREFITLLGSTAATWPLAARAQQRAMPVIGFLSSTSPQVYAVRLPAFAQDLEAAAPALGMQLHVVQASTDHDLDTVFAALRADALVVGPYLFFNSRLEQLGALSLRHAVPTIFTYRKFVAAGGLISYGANETESYRLVGIYAGKILKGAKPSDLPVQRSTKVELIINLKTAKALGITVPLALSGRADELIE